MHSRHSAAFTAILAAVLFGATTPFAKPLLGALSPFMVADHIKVPILLIHGEADNNSGTFPIQSDRMYRAIKGNGGMVRYVTLPSEAHGYAARESIEHTLWEMLTWFDTYVKNPTSSGASTTGQR